MIDLKSIESYVEKQIKECIVNSSISRFDRDENFFGENLNYEPHEVAAILYKCFNYYNVNLYDELTLDDLSIVKIAELIGNKLLTTKNSTVE